MAPITTASDETNHQALLDKLDMFKIHKPFRNPNWRPPQRRNKNLKQILSEAQRKEQSMLQTQNNSGVATPSSTAGTAPSAAAAAAQDLGRQVTERTLLAPSNSKRAPPLPFLAGTGPQASYSYTSIAAAPSFKSKRKYCDITGLPARYQDPKSGLRYYDKEIYAIVKTLNTAQIQEYLANRGAHTVLK